jgi:biopolymer transport protein ExbB
MAMNMTLDIVNLVLLFLAMLSVLVWGVVIYKGWVFYKINQQNKYFADALKEVKHLRGVVTIARDAQGSLARVCKAGLDELFHTQHDVSLVNKQYQPDMVLHALRNQVYQEQSKLESGLSVLASIGSTAPFIGLFGTVWGIMHALKDISATGSAGLDVVAGPIGEALIATAIGIATAVPAVLAYNYFLRKLKTSNAQMDNFGDTFQYLIMKSGLRE